MKISIVFSSAYLAGSGESQAANLFTLSGAETLSVVGRLIIDRADLSNGAQHHGDGKDNF